MRPFSRRLVRLRQCALYSWRTLSLFFFFSSRRRHTRLQGDWSQTCALPICIFIIREAFNKIERLAMLWSVGKDSQTILWLARKAFFGHVPFPCVFMETSFDMPELVELRDR